MNMSKQEYLSYVKEISPPSPLGKNMLCAFLVGGAICTVGQLFSNWYTSMDIGKDAASTATSVTMIFLGALRRGHHHPHLRLCKLHRLAGHGVQK